MKEENKNINDEKWELKDILHAILLSGIIIILILILIKVIKLEPKNQKENKVVYKEFEVTPVSETYSMLQSDTKGFKIEIECNKTTKVDIETQKSSVFSDDSKVTALGNNLYTITCEDLCYLYWTPDETIETNKIISIKFKTDEKDSKTKEIKIQNNQTTLYTIVK